MVVIQCVLCKETMCGIVNHATRDIPHSANEWDGDLWPFINHSAATKSDLHTTLCELAADVLECNFYYYWHLWAIKYSLPWPISNPLYYILVLRNNELRIKETTPKEGDHSKALQSFTSSLSPCSVQLRIYSWHSHPGNESQPKWR